MLGNVHAQTRQAIRIEGVVQGVGFCPFVHRLALRHGLRGFVRSETGAVALEVEGDERALYEFVRGLEFESPFQARIRSLRSETRPLGEDLKFTIQTSLADLAAAPGGRA